MKLQYGPPFDLRYIPYLSLPHIHPLKAYLISTLEKPTSYQPLKGLPYISPSKAPLKGAGTLPKPPEGPESGIAPRWLPAFLRRRPRVLGAGPGRLGKVPGSLERGLQLEVLRSYKGALYPLYHMAHILWYRVCGIWYILLEVQGSYNQAITVDIKHL